METAKLSLDERLEQFMDILEKSLAKSRAEADALAKKRMEEDAIAKKRMEEADAIAKKRMEEADALAKKRMEEADARMKKIEQQLGGIGNNNGYFAEEFFYSSFEKKDINFLGERYDRIMKSVKGFIKPDEYDIIMVNGKSACIIETKYKANEKHIQHVLKKAGTFRYNFPEYKEHTLYLGLASMAFYKELEEECERLGIAVIKQVGDAIVVNHEHLRAY